MQSRTQIINGGTSNRLLCGPAAARLFEHAEEPIRLGEGANGFEGAAAV